jgi:hypothetical protein
MPAGPVPARPWRSYGTEPLATPAAALDEMFNAFPSWFLRVTCDRCGQQRMFSETHAAGQRDMLIRDIIARMRHDGCGGRAGKVAGPAPATAQLRLADSSWIDGGLYSRPRPSAAFVAQCAPYRFAPIANVAAEATKEDPA